MAMTDAQKMEVAVELAHETLLIHGRRARLDGKGEEIPGSAPVCRWCSSAAWPCKRAQWAHEVLDASVTGAGWNGVPGRSDDAA